jgi:HK97 family phage major capsid protein
MSQFVEAIGQKLDSAAFIGTGDPVSGVFLSTGYSEVFSSGSTNFSALLEVNLRNVIGKIPTSRLGGAKWYGHRTPVWTYLYGLKDGDSRPLFIPSMTEGVPHRLYGYPLEMPEQSKSTSAVATGMLVFGNLKGFWIGERLGRISLFVNPYSLSTKYQTIFLMFTRWGFAHALPNQYARIVTAAS